MCIFWNNRQHLQQVFKTYKNCQNILKVVNYIKQQATFDYNKEISLQENNIDNSSNLNLINNDVDELYYKAVDIIISQQKVSTSFVQRYLQIGYNRAARIIEKMEENGIISEANNAGKRQILKKK